METIGSTINTKLLRKVQESWVQDQYLQHIISALFQKSQVYPKYSWSQELLKRKGKLVVGKDESLRQSVIKLVHNSPFKGSLVGSF